MGNWVNMDKQALSHLLSLSLSLVLLLTPLSKGCHHHIPVLLQRITFLLWLPCDLLLFRYCNLIQVLITRIFFYFTSRSPTINYGNFKLQIILLSLDIVYSFGILFQVHRCLTLFNVPVAAYSLLIIDLHSLSCPFDHTCLCSSTMYIH